PARHDDHVEAIFLVGAVGERLVEAPMLDLGHPVGAEANLVERSPLRRRQADHKTQENCGKSRHLALRHGRPDPAYRRPDQLELFTAPTRPMHIAAVASRPNLTGWRPP